jgi:uncharacterized repeat protein (TIGR01451 family)
MIDRAKMAGHRQRRGSKGLILVVMLVFVFGMQGGTARAQQGPRLDLQTTVEKEIRVQKGGKWVTERAPADRTGPGDILVYTIAYRNAGAIPATDAAIVDPIPPGVVCLPDTAEGQDAEITFSIDNSRSWHKPPVMMQVKRPDGTLESKPVPPERYTHIRWIIKKPVLPGQSGRVSFKATVK